MHIQPLVGTVIPPFQPEESANASLPGQTQYLESRGETLLSQHASTVQPQMNTQASLHTTTYNAAIMVNIAREWGMQDINMVERVASRLNCTLNELRE